MLQCEGDYFKFFHKSLIEYFAQEHIFKGAMAALDAHVKETPLNTILREPVVLNMLAERAKKEPDFVKRLFQILNDSKSHQDVAIAASNAISILHRAGFSLNKEPLYTDVIDNLSGVRIPGADLSGAMLHRANLQGTDLTDVNLRDAYCVEADLRHAIVRGVDWGQNNNIVFDYNITALTFVWGRPLLVVGNSKGQLHFIDTRNYLVTDVKDTTPWHVLQDRTKRDYSITALAVNGAPSEVELNDSDVLASGASNGFIAIWSLPGRMRLTSIRLSDQSIKALAWTPGGDYLAIGAQNNFYLHQFDKRKNRLIPLQNFNFGSNDDKESIQFIHFKFDSLARNSLEWIIGTVKAVYVRDQLQALNRKLDFESEYPIIFITSDWKGEHLVILTSNNQLVRGEINNNKWQPLETQNQDKINSLYYNHTHRLFFCTDHTF